MKAALRDAFLSALVAFGLFAPMVGLLTESGPQGLYRSPLERRAALPPFRPAWLADSGPISNTLLGGAGASGGPRSGRAAANP